MNKISVNLLIYPLMSLLSLVNPSVSQAKPIIYDFTVRVTDGALQGNSFQGFFIYDDESVSGSGKEEIGVEEGLKVCMNFFGQNYAETNDSNYPNLPKLTLNDGEVENLDFWIEEERRLPWWNLQGWEVSTTQRETSEDLPTCLPSNQS
ncbi:MAG: hypothetical protein AB4041_15330 [Microcystaceae cyanobacterium]